MNSNKSLLAVFVNVAFLRAGAMILAVVIEAFLVRSMPPDIYTNWGVVLSFVILAVVFVQFGYQTSALIIFSKIRDGKDATDVAEVLFSILFSVFVNSIFLFVFVSLFFEAMFGFGLTVGSAILLTAFASMRALNTSFAEGMRGWGKVQAASLLNGLGQHGGIVRSVLLAASLFFLSLFNLIDLNAVLWVSALTSGIVAFFLYLYILSLTNGRIRFREVSLKSHFEKYFMTNLRLMSSEQLQALSTRSAATLVGAVVGLKLELLPLILAQQLIQLVGAPLTVLNSAIPALLISAHNDNDQSKVEMVLRSGSTASFYLSCLIALCFVLGGDWLLILIFGQAGNGVWQLLLWMLPGFLFHSFTGSAGRALAILGFDRELFWLSAVSSCLGLVFFLCGAYFFGAQGLAIAVSLSLIIQKMAYWVAVYRKIGVLSHGYVNAFKAISNLIALK